MKILLGIYFVYFTFNGVIANCSDPTPENGFATFNSLAYGSSATITCVEGFKTYDQNTSYVHYTYITCNSDGTWSRDPRCIEDKLIQCGDPRPNNSSTWIESTQYRNFAYVSCEEGYTSYHENYPGYEEMICKTFGNGEWILYDPSLACVQGCTNITLDNLQLNDTSRSYNTTVKITCDEGFAINGSSTITCQTDGSWTNETNCIPIECDDPSPENGYVEIISATDARISCNESYTISDESHIYIKCQDGNWSATPYCAPDCDIPLLDNGQVNDTSRSYNTTVEIVCDEGFAINGSSTITCQINGSWTDEPNCSKIGCTTPLDCPNDENFVCVSGLCIYDCGNPSVFEVDGINLTFTLQYGNLLDGDVVYYSCPDGYIMSGNSIGTCVEGGWTDVQPICLRDCGSLPALVNGTLTLDDSNNTTEGSTATVSCDDGYSESSTSIQCLDTGQWEDAQCLIECSDPTPENGFATFNSLAYGSSATITCVEGFVTFDNNTNKITYRQISCENDGTWSRDPQCVKDTLIQCGDPRPNNSSTWFNSTQYRGVAYVSCEEGYTSYDADYPGYQEMVCWIFGNGEWVLFDASSACVQGCTNITLDNLQLNDTSRSYNTTVKITCDKGFAINGSSTITCQTDGSWTNETNCIPIECDDPSPENGYVEIISATDARISCNESYTISDESHIYIKCQDGNWSATPYCAPDCDIPLLDNGQVNDTSRSYNTTVEITCDEGFAINGSSTITCQINGSWTDEPNCSKIGCTSDAECAQEDNFACINGQCACPDSYFLHINFCIYDCGNPPVFEVDGINLTYTLHFGNFLDGDIVYYFCPDGYDMSGNSIGSCVEGGWTDMQPVCLRDCGSLPAIDNGNLTLDNSTNTTEGASATVTCDDGYSESSITIQCLDTGQWEDGNCTLTGCISDADCPEGYNFTCDSGQCECPSSYFKISDICFYDCGSPPVFEVDGTNLTYTLLYDDGLEDDIVSYFCPDGYNMTGNSIGTCVDGGWTDVQPVCLLDCGSLPSIANGNLTLDNSTNTLVGSTATVFCDEGFSESSDSIQCLEIGQWEYANCTVIDCGGDFNISNSWVTLNNESDTTFGASAEVECHYGYETNVTTILCETTGEWGSTECTRIDCGPIQEISNSNITLDVEGETRLGDRATVVCDEGYSTEVNSNFYKVVYIFCRGSGTWDNRTCEISDCGAPPNDTIDGTFTLDDEGVTTYGANATLICDEGFESSSPLIICDEFNAWSNYGPCFIKDCNSVPVIERGLIQPTDGAGNTTYGSEANVTCDLGFNPSAGIIKCLSTGNWENASCEIIDCGAPPNNTLDGTFSLDDEGMTTYGANATLICDEGFESSDPVITCEESDTWPAYEPCIIKDCGAPPNNTLDGTFSLDDEGMTTYGANATLICDEGFESSDPVITCEESDTWPAYEPCIIKDCDTVPVIERGLITPAGGAGNTTYGSEANVTCDLGFNPSTDVIKCLSTGNWENASCEIIVCRDVPSINDGSIALQESGNNTYGALADVTCALGYNATLDTIECLDTGEWENATCNIVVCGDVPSIFNGSIVLQENGNKTFGNLAVVTCDIGYIAEKDTIQCLETGNWDNTTCDIVVCGDVPSINDGSIALQENGNNSYGDLADVTCDIGYNASLNIISCLDTGKWENATCDIVVCGDVPSIDDGSIALQENGNNSYGAIADVTCAVGYNATLDTIECLDTGQWENTSCDIVVCDDIPSINDGSIALQKNGNNTYGALADVTCNTGYNASLDIIECLETGKWENTTCDIIVCGEVPSINDGNIALQENGNNTYGALAEVTCVVGYNATLDTIACLDTGKWENATCDIVVCGDIPSINEGSIALQENGNYTYGALADVTCAVGYNATLDTIACLDTGKWENATCDIVVCGDAPAINDGSIALQESGNNTYGALAGVTCEKGYNATFDTIQCLDTGNWENTTCDIVVCGDVPSIDDGSIELQENGNNSYGALADVTCDLGYNATLDTIDCLEIGQWENTTCDIVVCDDIPLINDGSIVLQENGNNTYGALADVTCAVGYNATLDTITCLDTGKWENTTCDIVVCGDPPTIIDGNIALQESGNNTYGALAGVTCEKGYNATLDTIQCLDTGNWENATCDIVVCGDVPSINDGSLALQESGNNSFGALADVRCNKGYNATQDTIECLDTGKWENTTCDIVVCGVVPSINYGSIVLQENGNISFGALADVTCNKGYNASLDTIKCLDTGKWENTSCDIVVCGDVPSIDDGGITLQEPGNTSYGALANVTCEKGYNATFDTIQCLETGKWDNTSCNIVVCGDAPSINDGDITLQENGNNSFGALADVTCEKGYNTTLDTIQCLKTGIWENTTCDIVVCGDIPSINDGSIALQETGTNSYGALADVTCDTGYNATFDTIACLDTGDWENTTCNIVDCDEVPLVTKGTVTLLDENITTYEAFANVTCEDGYNASLSRIQCQETGRWQKSECQILDCEAVPDVTNGVVSLLEAENTTYGTVAEVTCDKGYNSTPGTIRCLETGDWETPECVIVDCEATTAISNGQITLVQEGNTTYGALANVTCLEGYNASFDIIECLHTGEWDNATCDLIVCGEVPSLDGGNIALQEKGNNSFAALADVTCDKGFNTTLDTIRCLDTGKWENTSCDIIVCGAVPSIDDGIIALQDNGNSSYGALADVTCAKGYNTTLDTIQCLDTGKWENTTCNIVVCGDVPSINNGSIALQESGNNTYGALADVTCAKGYNPTLGTIQCLDTGTWENATCDIVVCGDVPLINYGSIALKESGNNSFGALADVTCAKGYNTTLDTIQCLDTGRWTNTSCDIIVCGDVPSINNGSIALQENGNNSYGALADVTCVKGYNTTLDTIQCLDTGRWENTTCDIMVCGYVPGINDGSIALQKSGDNTYGALADVTCAKGYNASLDFIQCLETGKWENTTCDIVVCGDVPHINGGSIVLQENGNNSHGALAGVTCEKGYNTTLDTIQCLDTGKWENTTCDIVVCGAVPSINDGSIALQDEGNNSYGALADVKCDKGYNTTLHTIQCLDTGNWENATCDIIVCGDVPQINDGKVVLREDSNNSYSALADVECDMGYNATLDTIQCLDTGNWESTTCNVVECGHVPQFDNGSVDLKVDGVSSYGAEADVTCEIGFNATLETITCLDTGKWDNTSCEIIDCEEAPVVIKGTVTLLDENNITFGALANVSCEDGYNASISKIQCLQTGRWQITECQILDCEAVPDVLNGDVSLLEAENTTYGTLAEVTCDKGYNSTSNTIRCLETGDWETPECEILNCGATPDISDGQITLAEDGRTTFGALANVACLTGYNATVDTIECLDTGKWDNASCALKDCGDVPELSNGNLELLEKGKTTFGALAKINCETGYNSSMDTIHCHGIGVWGSTSCDIIVCEPSPAIENGEINLQEAGNYSFGALAEVICNLGHTSSTEVIHCGETGNWDTANCLINDCGDLDAPVNGTKDTSNGTTYGSTATYACDEGFVIVGDETRVCLQNGKWSNMKPDCLLEGSIRCPKNTDARETVWNEVAAGRNRSQDCKANFTGTIKRQCGNDGVWKFPQYLCVRESVTNAINKIGSLNENASQQDVLNALQDLKGVTTQAENIEERDKLTDLEMSNLISSSGTVADLLSESPDIVSNELTNDLTETFSNLIDNKNTGSWNAITQTSSKVAEKVLTSVDTLYNAMAKRVKSSGADLQPVVKPNLALHVRAMTSEDFVFPGPDSLQGSSSGNWLNETRSQINFDPASFGGSNEGTSVVSAAMFRDISNIMPNKSEDEQLNGQILSFSTLPPLTGTIDPPITMSFEQSNAQLTKAACSFWKFKESGGDGYWSTEGCTATSTSEGLTECACNHTTNFAVILSLQDCGSLNSIDNGEIDSSSGTEYKATVRFKCNNGYNVVGANTSVCLFNGSWSFPNPTCSIKDCGSLVNPANGIVSTPGGTTYDKEAEYRCNSGYEVNGAVRRLCLSNGIWSSSAPTCVATEKEPTYCYEEPDNRGLTWPKTLEGNVIDQRCQEGFTGAISRSCGAGGEWRLPQYNCIREAIEKVNEKVSTLNENATVEEVDTVLEEILKVTSLNETTESDDTLTDGELSVLSSSLETVADVLKSTTGVINENITEEFLEIASNLVDESNQDSWKSLSQTEDNDESERVLKAVDSLAEVLSDSLEDDSESNGTLIVKKNIAIEVKRVSNNDVVFPDPGQTVPDEDDANANWFKDSSSSLRLDASSLTNTSVSYSTTSVIFRDLSKILPNRRNDSDDSSTDANDTINAPILSLTISPPVTTKLNPPLRLTFVHKDNSGNLSNSACVYWAFPKGKIGQGAWSSEGCVVNSTNTNYTVCECDHLTNFAVLMSPFIEADAASEALRIISMVGIGISMACLAATLFVHIWLWQNLRNDRTTALANLCVALLLSYILFLAGVDRTESSVACAVIAAVLQYIYLVVFCIMLVEGIEIAITVLYVFKTKSRIKIMLIFAWVIPAIIVGISLGATQADGYGNDNFCWLSVDNGLIWAFVGPALFIITFNAICLIIVIRIMFKTKAMETKTVSEKMKTSVRSLCVLVPVMGVSWILGIFYMNDSFYFIQYIFAILNGLQGFFIFLFHCLLNEQVKKAIQLRNRRRSSMKESLKTTLRSTSRDYRKSKDLRETGKSFLDSGDFTQEESSNNWKDKIIQPEYSQTDVKFETPLGFYGKGRRTATFGSDLRDKLTSQISGSASDASNRSRTRVEHNLFSARL